MFLFLDPDQSLQGAEGGSGSAADSWGFHKWCTMVYPNSWMVDFMENPSIKWMK